MTRSHAILAAYALLAVAAFLLSSHWTYKGVKIFLHDSAQVERFAD